MLRWQQEHDLYWLEDHSDLKRPVISFAIYENDEGMPQLSLGDGGDALFIDQDQMIAMLPFLKHFAITGEFPSIKD